MCGTLWNVVFKPALLWLFSEQRTTVLHVGLVPFPPCAPNGHGHRFTVTCVQVYYTLMSPPCHIATLFSHTCT